MRRCKLISPTNLMLEQPILSPVDECEYYLLGVKEHGRILKAALTRGLMAGAVLGLVFAALIVAIADRFLPACH